MLLRWAAIKMGCKIMPISPRNLTNEQEVMHMVATGLLITGGGAKQVVLAGTDDLAKIVEELNLFPHALKIVVDGAEGPDWMSFKELVADKQQDITEALAMSPSDQGGTIIFTSGTTALPKGVYMSFEQNFSRVLPGLPQNRRGVMGPGSKLCGVMPNNHSMGWVVLTMCLVSEFLGCSQFLSLNFRYIGRFRSLPWTNSPE